MVEPVHIKYTDVQIYYGFLNSALSDEKKYPVNNSVDKSMKVAGIFLKLLPFPWE